MSILIQAPIFFFDDDRGADMDYSFTQRHNASRLVYELVKRDGAPISIENTQCIWLLIAALTDFTPSQLRAIFLGVYGQDDIVFSIIAAG